MHFKIIHGDEKRRIELPTPLKNDKALARARRHHGAADKPMRLHVAVADAPAAGAADAAADGPDDSEAFAAAAERLAALGVPMTGDGLRVVLGALDVAPRRLARCGLVEGPLPASMEQHRGRPSARL